MNLAMHLPETFSLTVELSKKIFCGYFFHFNAYLVCGIPYLMPTPTRGRALIIFLSVLESGKANMIDAEKQEMHRNITLTGDKGSI